MIISKYFDIQSNIPNESGILISPSAYLLSIPKSEAIIELEDYILRNKISLSKSEGEDDLTIKNIRLEISLLDAFLSQLKEGYSLFPFKYLDFEKDNIDLLEITKDILGQDVLEDISRQAINEALKRNDAKVFFDVGNEQFQNKLYQEAIQSYKKAISIDTSLETSVPDTHYNLGLAYYKLNEFENSIGSYKEALRIDPSYPAHYNLGLSYTDTECFSEAIECFNIAINNDPDNAEIYYDLGYVYKKLGMHEKALNLCIKAVEINPNDYGAYYNLGICHSTLGNIKEAIKAYRQAILINNSFIDAHYNLFKVYISIGDEDSATEEYYAIKELNPDLASELIKL